MTSGPPERLIEESGLAARVVLPRAALGTVGEADLTALPVVVHVRGTETDLYLYGDGDLVGDVSDYLGRRGVSAGFNADAAGEPGRHLFSGRRE